VGHLKILRTFAQIFQSLGQFSGHAYAKLELFNAYKDLNIPQHRFDIRHHKKPIHSRMSAKKTTLRILSSLKSIISEDFSCPICSEPCTDTLANLTCGHRFCGKCIKAEGEGNHDCPTCGLQIAAFQSCRADLHFDRIVSPYPDCLYFL
jgi:hypothetical protein